MSSILLFVDNQHTVDFKLSQTKIGCGLLESSNNLLDNTSICTFLNFWICEGVLELKIVKKKPVDNKHLEETYLNKC